MTTRRFSNRSKPVGAVQLPSTDELKRIVQQGDIDLAVRCAEAIGERLATPWPPYASGEPRNV